jgi:hypothetical protein
MSTGATEFKMTATEFKPFNPATPKADAPMTMNAKAGSFNPTAMAFNPASTAASFTPTSQPAAQ